MAQRIEVRNVLIPAGTLQSSPLIFTLPWREGYPTFAEFMFPPGPSGLVGIQLRHSGRRIIPKDLGTYLIADNDTLKYELEGFPYNANYTIQAYNEGAYDHSIQVRMGFNEIGRESISRVSGTLIQMPITAPGNLLEGSEAL